MKRLMISISISCMSLFTISSSPVFASDKFKFDCDQALVNQVKTNDFEVKSKPQCISADFNGDGQQDTLVFKEVLSKKSSVSSTFLARVYFLNKGQVSKSIAIDHKFQLPPMTYQSDEGYKEYGCPASDLTGIIDPGEGGTNYIYLWQRATLKFEEFRCRSEND